MTDRPAVRTVANVELVDVGSWKASTGEWSPTPDDLYAAAAAQSDPGYTTPILKLGHVDERFDGEPALGRIVNLRVENDGMTLVGDVAGVPAWLADLMESTYAYPSRSIEGEVGHVTQTGTKHRFALTALSLLGVTRPAISTLADVASLYGLDPVAVAAAAAASLEDRVPEDDNPRPVSSASPTPVAAAVSLDQVRSAWYSQDDTGDLGPWAWVREVYATYVIVDDDEGGLYQIPWSEAAASGSVDFNLDGKQKVAVEYVPVSDPEAVAASAAGRLAAGSLRARLARIAPTDPAPVSASGTTTEEDTVDDSTLAGLRKAAGLPDDADEATILAGVVEALNERAETPPTPETPGAPVVPEGLVLVEEEVINDLRQVAARGQEAHDRFMRQDRDSTIKAAVADGRISRATVSKWTERWDKAPEDTAEVLAALAPGLVPVTPSGFTSESDPSLSDDDEANLARLFPDMKVGG